MAETFISPCSSAEIERPATNQEVAGSNPARGANMEVKILLLDDYLESLQEVSKRTSITRVTRQTKIDRAIGQLSTKYAKEVNDPMYRKMVRFRDKFYKLRDRIRAKYAPRVRTRAIQGKGLQGLDLKKK